MGQDSKIFYSLFTNPKKGYKSLQETYLEQPPVAVPELPRQSVNVKPDIAPIFNFNKSTTTPLMNWDSIARGLFNELKTLNEKDGLGRGEYSVAYILTGLRSKEEIDNYKGPDIDEIVGGKNRNFDINVPAGMFEVKEMGFNKTVKTGAHNNIVLSKIRRGLSSLLSPILEAYEDLDEDSKRILNNKLMQDAQEFVTNRYNAENIRLKRIKDAMERDLGYVNAKINVQGADAWTLQKYIQSILDKDRELPAGLLKSPYLQLGAYHERPYVIFSIKQLVDALLKFCRLPSTYDEDVEFYYQALKQKYKDINDDVLLRQATSIALETKSRIARHKKTFTDLDHFRKQIIHKQIDQLYFNLLDAFSGEGLATIFPNDGVFLVTGTDFQYITKADLNKFIEIDNISGGEVKIRRKGQGFNQPVYY